MLLREQAGLQLRYYSKNNGKLAKVVKQGGGWGWFMFLYDVRHIDLPRAGVEAWRSVRSKVV